MQRLVNKPARIFALLVVALLVIPLGLTWRAVRQTQLDQALARAMVRNDTQAVVSALDQGANANAHLQFSREATWWQLLQEHLHFHQESFTLRESALWAAINIDLGVLDHALGMGGLHAQADNPRIVQALLDHGAQMKAERFTPPLLCVAAENGETNTVQLLLERGLDVNVMDTVGGPMKGFTPLLYAAMRGRPKTIRCLLAHGADVNACSAGGDRAIFYALEEDTTDSLQAELKAGANIDVQAVGGHTPLMQAAVNGNVAAVRVLLAHHANTQIRDKTGKRVLAEMQARVAQFANTYLPQSRTPADRASAQAQRERLNTIIQLLQTAGAKQ